MIDLKFLRVASDDSYTAATPVMRGGTGYAYRITHRGGVWLATYRYIGEGVTASPVKYWPVRFDAPFYRTKRDAVAAANRHAAGLGDPGLAVDHGTVFDTADRFGWVDQNPQSTNYTQPLVYERTRALGTALALSPDWVHDRIELTYAGGWLIGAVAVREDDGERIDITAREGMSLDDTVVLALSAPIADDVFEVLLENGVGDIAVAPLHAGYWGHDDATVGRDWFKSTVRVTVPVSGVDDVVAAVGTIDGWVATVTESLTDDGDAVIIVTAK